MSESPKYELIITKNGPRDGSGWSAKFLKNGAWVADATLQQRTETTIEFVWFSVDCGNRKQGIGRKFVQAIAAHFPNNKLYARDIIDTGRIFWDRLISDGLVHETVD